MSTLYSILQLIMNRIFVQYSLFANLNQYITLVPSFTIIIFARDYGINGSRTPHLAKALLLTFMCIICGNTQFCFCWGTGNTLLNVSVCYTFHGKVGIFCPKVRNMKNGNFDVTKQYISVKDTNVYFFIPKLQIIKLKT